VARFRTVRKLLFVLGAIPVGAVFLLLLLFGAGVQAGIFRAYVSPTPSMYPTIRAKERLIAMNIHRPWTRGELVVFKNPKDSKSLLIKRVVGIGGDQMLVQNDMLSVNGKKVERRPAKEPCREGCSLWTETLDGTSYEIALGDTPPHESAEFGPSTVPEGHVFVLGDNRDSSLDSRFFGPVANELLVGIPEFIYWSSDETGIHWSRMGRLLR
jgi:signal peptidase I